MRSCVGAPAQKLLASGTSPSSAEWEAHAEFAAALSEFDRATELIHQGLKVNADNWEATLALATVSWEKVKAKIGYVAALPPT